MFRTALKSLVFLFLAYNLFLGAVLVDVLNPTGTSIQTTTSFSDSDFGLPPTPPPLPPLRISKPFFEVSGQVLAFNLEAYAVNNVTQLPIIAAYCGGCETSIVALPLSPPPAIAWNGTFLPNPGATYRVTRSANYVLIYDTRTPFLCEGYANCTLRLSGTVTASAPIGPSPYSSLPVILSVLGTLAITPPIYWTFQKRRQTNPPI